ncbi:hypothetical protein TRFO_33720 [Tritrichomonas foetus]|uniref:DUF4704 domain-containing protein n=1 Tax=Tritrichomonas foetus TaxID=1144522 RepID=A0A1J4JM43_9EUKA|nr:hypothetical protein TRFO_33720 [Tritrichomonas foetus]|eukprot:OHS99761.1 hypothetical protein TRFO_33720 [Tritrichomonas foetus]
MQSANKMDLTYRDFLDAVFSLETPTPVPSLSHSFINLVPSINVTLLKSRDASDEQLINELRLSFTDRFPALSVMKENKYSFLLSEDGKTFASIFILQSITPYFLNSVKILEPEFLRLFIDLLKFSKKISPQFDDLNLQAFGFLYQKCAECSQFMSVLPNITKYLKNVLIPPTNWFKAQVSCIKAILLSMFSRPSPYLLALAATHLVMMIPFFSKLESKSQSYENLNDIYDLIYKFDAEFSTKFPEFEKNQNYLDMRTTLYRIGLELNRITSTLFKQYLPIIFSKITEPIISNDELSLKIEPISKNCEVDTDTLLKDDDQQLELEEGEKIEFEKIENILSSINHPIMDLCDEIAAFPEKTISGMIQLIISEGFQEIINGNISFHIFAFLLMNERNDLSEVSQFIVIKNIKSIFFTEALFNPAITNFNYPQSRILSVRMLVIHIFTRLINENPLSESFFIPILTNHLNRFVLYPEMFSEFANATIPILCKYNKLTEAQLVILNCFSSALQAQQYAKFNNKLVHHRAVRSLAFNALRQYIESVILTKPKYYFVSSFFSDILLMIYEISVCDSLFLLIEKYCSIFISSEPPNVVALFNGTIETLNIIIHDIKKFRIPCAKLLKTLFRVLCSLTNAQIEAIKTTEFFEKVRSIIFLDDADIDSIANALIIDHFAPKRQKEARWHEIANIVAKHEFSDSMYQSLLIILSHNNEPFTSIANQNAIYVIPSALESKYSLHFLRKILKMLRNSIPDRILFSELGIITYVIKLLNEDSDEELWEIVMEICKLVFTHSTKRNDLFSFFRLLSPISEHVQSKHVKKALSVIVDLVAQQPAKYRSIIRFTSRSGLIKLPSIPLKDLVYGFTISENVMISNYQNPSDCLRLFKFTNGSTFMIAELYSSCLVILSSLYNNKELIVEFKFPVNEWFVLSLSFTELDFVSVYVNKKKVGEANLNLPSIDCPDLFNDNVLFGGDSQGFVECHFTRAAIFINNPETEFPNIHSDEKLASDQRTYFLIDSVSYIKGKLHNLAHSSTSYYDFSGQLIPNVSSFNSTFLYSKGLEFVISLFSQIDYKITSEDYSNEQYFTQLLELICILIQMSDSVQAQLVKINAFETLAHFMYNSNSFEMNFDISSTIFKIQPCIRYKRLLTSFVRSILLNFPLWKGASVKMLKELFKAWKLSTSYIPDVLTNELRPQIILNTLKTLEEENLMNQEIRSILFDILVKSLCIECNSQDLAMIISVMKLHSNDSKIIIEFLMMLDNFVGKSPSQMGNVSRTLVTTEWLALNSDPNIQLTLIKHFMQSDVNLLVQFILKIIDSASWNEQNINDEILLSGCNIFAGVESKTFEDLIDQSSKWEVNELLLPILLSHAMFASDEVCDKFSQFLLTVFSLGEQSVIVRESINGLTLFLLISFEIFKRSKIFSFNNDIDSSSTNASDAISGDIKSGKNEPRFLLVLISSNPHICSRTFKMIDLISYISHIDFHQFQSNLALDLTKIVFDHNYVGDRDQYIDILTNFICFHTRIKKKSDSSLDFLKLVGLMKKGNLTLPKYTFYMQMEKNVWIDKHIVSRLIKGIINIREQLNLSRFSMLLSFICHQKVFNRKIPLILDKFLKKAEADSRIWIPVIYQVARHPADFEEAKAFMTTFGSKLKISIDMYSNYCEYFNQFISNFTFEQPIPENIGNAIHQELIYDDSAAKKTRDAIEDVK